MITEMDLQEAIAECEGQRSPTAQTCIKLAAFYAIRDKMYPQKADGADTPPARGYSYAAESRASYDSDTEFMSAARDLPTGKLLEVLDEVMTALSVLNPKLYQAAIRKMLEN